MARKVFETPFDRDDDEDTVMTPGMMNGGGSDMFSIRPSSLGIDTSLNQLSRDIGSVFQGRCAEFYCDRCDKKITAGHIKYRGGIFHPKCKDDQQKEDRVAAAHGQTPTTERMVEAKRASIRNAERAIEDERKRIEYSEGRIKDFEKFIADVKAELGDVQ